MSDRKEYNKKWYAENKDKKREKSKEKYIENKDKIIERQANYRINNRDKINAYQREYKQRTSSKYDKYRRTSLSNNREFTLTLEEFENLITQDCIWCKEQGGGIDRIDNNVGYILSNCSSCCSSCNYMRGSLTVEEFKEKVKKIYSYL